MGLRGRGLGKGEGACGATQATSYQGLSKILNTGARVPEYQAGGLRQLPTPGPARPGPVLAMAQLLQFVAAVADGGNSVLGFRLREWGDKAQPMRCVG